MAPRATRRELLTGAGGFLAGSTTAAALGPTLAAAAPAQVEARALTQAMQVEQLLVISYRQVTASSVLKPAVRSQLQTVLAQEGEHLSLLSRALEGRGEIVPAPPNLAAAQAELTRHQIHWSLTRLRNQHDCLKLLVDVESVAENAYFDAVANLQDARLIRLSAEIMACEAQHWTILAGLLNHQDPKRAVPYPFVAGAT
jgi:rubrerythrin